MIKLTDSNFVETINSEKLVIVDFFGEWCGPCRALSPILEEISKEGDVTVGKLDIDECLDIAEKYNISSVPTLVFFKKGEQVGKLVGLRHKQQILTAIEQYK